METIQKSVIVEAPVRTVYNQWTQFEDFPKFMEGVEEVRQLDNKRLFWRARIWGKLEEWEAEIRQQVADECIAWRSVTGARNSGIVTFRAISAATTEVTLRLQYEPESTLEKLGDALGCLSLRVEQDLDRFRKFVEDRGHETGGWRGQIQGGAETPPRSTAA